MGEIKKVITINHINKWIKQITNLKTSGEKLPKHIEEEFTSIQMNLYSLRDKVITHKHV